MIASKPIISTISKELHPFIKKSFKTWIKSAVYAKCFRPNVQYIVDIDRSESAIDRYPKIIIMDNETGTEQESSQWNNGLHQFLQLKHHLRLDTESLKAVYMSNISFFTQYYTNIMGVTGTIGSTDEYRLFHRLYKGTTVIEIPTYRPSRLQIEEPVNCKNDPKKWKAAIYDDVSSKIISGRSVLLICANVKSAEELHKHFKKEFSCETTIKLYISSHQQKLEEAGKIESGVIIIATNLAGRGTDIALSDSVKENGGLHVCLTYLPPNMRVEQQAYGRAARNGDKGSCKMIFCSKEQSITYAIQQRNTMEAHRVADIETDYLYNVKFQEELFKRFTNMYKQVKFNKKHRTNLEYCLDCWALFLDEHTQAIESIPHMHTHQERLETKDKILILMYTDLLPKLENIQSSKRWIQLGHYYMKKVKEMKGRQKESVIIKQRIKNAKKNAVDKYGEACKYNPEDPFAIYYKESAIINKTFRSKISKGKKHRRKYKQALYKLIPLFTHKIYTCMEHIHTLSKVACHQDLSLTDGNNFYQEQKQHEINVYKSFIRSIHNIVGHDFTHETCMHVCLDEFQLAGRATAFEMIKEKLGTDLKDERISKNNWFDRLNHLFQTDTTYNTFQKKITMKIHKLTEKQTISEDDIDEILPNKRSFWKLLCDEGVITDVSDDIGYWNPYKVPQWDPITEESFADLPNSSELIQYLKQNSLLYRKGKICKIKKLSELKLRIHVPAKYNLYHNQIKNALRNHCESDEYEFLCKCVVIDNIDYSCYLDKALGNNQWEDLFCYLPDSRELLQHLKENGILNENGQICGKSLSKPMNLPAKYKLYHKKIQKTLKKPCACHFTDKNSRLDAITEEWFAYLPNLSEMLQHLKENGILNENGQICDKLLSKLRMLPLKYNPYLEQIEDTLIKHCAFTELPDPGDLVQHLKQHGILNENGQLCGITLSKPMNLPAKYTPYYKQIKDTLKKHCTYRFAYEELCQCFVVDSSVDVHNEQPNSEQVCGHTTDTSITLADVPNILQSMKSRQLPQQPQQVDAQPQQVDKKTQQVDKQSQVNKDALSKFELNDHLPTTDMNRHFKILLNKNQLIATEVSGAGSNCLINALIQHATEEYTIVRFKEADVIRESLKKKFPDEVRMLHSSGQTGVELLKLVNDNCSTEENKIGKVTEVIASANEPFILLASEDERYPNGRHVVIWQQGYHYVCIVPKKRVELISPQTISKEQFEILKRLNLIAKCSEQFSQTEYRICSSLNESRRVLLDSKNISDCDRTSCMEFLESKLRISFLTLNCCPSFNHHNLYVDLCLYSVIKKEKFKTMSQLNKIGNFFKQIGECVEKSIFTGWELDFLNTFLKFKCIPEICLEDLETLKEQHSWSIIQTMKEFKTQLEKDIDEVKYLSLKQKEGFVDYHVFLISFKKCEKYILSKLDHNRSTLLDVDIPEVSLVCLSDFLEDGIQGKEDIYYQFCTNQCNFVAQVGEKKWSARSIGLSLAILAAGVGQLAIGAATAAAGVVPLLSMVGIGEGISDIFFGIECLIKGQCTMKRYFKHKLYSLAFTASFVGFGAFAVGVKSTVSKGALKAVKSGFSAIRNTLFVTNITESGAHLLSEVVMRSVKQGAGKIIEFGLEKVVNYALNKHSDSMDALCNEILHNFDDIEANKQLRENMIVFLRQHPEKSKEMLRQVTLQTLKNRSYVELWESIVPENKLTEGLHEGVEVAAEWSELFEGASDMLKFLVLIVPIISNAIKTGLVKKQVALIIKDWEANLEKHNNKASKEVITEYNNAPEEELTTIVRHEIEFVKKELLSQMRKRVELIINASKNLLKEEVLKPVEHGCVKSFQDQLENSLGTDDLDQSYDSESVSDIQEECEQNMPKLLLLRQNYDVYTSVTESQSVPIDAKIKRTFTTSA